MKKVTGLIRSSSDARHDLHRVLSGTGIVFAGILLIYAAEHLLPSSLQQELVAAGGLLLVTGGALLTLRGYLLLCLTRLTRPFNDQRP